MAIDSEPTHADFKRYCDLDALKILESEVLMRVTSKPKIVVSCSAVDQGAFQAMDENAFGDQSNTCGTSCLSEHLCK